MESKSLWISEEYVGEDDNGQRWRSGDPDPYESRFTTGELGRVFRAMQKEHGFFAGSVYVDNEDGVAIRVGWTFRKRVKYQDCNETFIQETWVTLHEGPAVKSVRYSYLSRAA